VKTFKPRSLTCSDVFLFGNTEVWHIDSFFFSGSHVLEFKLEGEDAIVDLKKNGFQTFMFCDSYRDEIMSIITTLKAFIGGLGVNGKIPLF